jgi:hypothetical protein
MAFPTWLLLLLASIVVYFVGLWSPVGRLLAFVCILIGKPLLRLESLLEVFKDKLMSSDSTHIGLRTVVVEVAGILASTVFGAETFNSFQALTSLYGNSVANLPSLPAVLNYAMGALFLACPALLGVVWLEIIEAVPGETRMFSRIPDKYQGIFQALVKWGLILSCIDSVLYYALRPLFLANPDSGVVLLLQFVVFVILGLVLPLASILALFILSVSIQTLIALFLALLWLVVSSLTDMCDFLSRYFLDHDHTIEGVRPVQAALPALSAAPVSPSLPETVITEEKDQQDTPLIEDTRPFPRHGRTREEFPIIDNGKPWFGIMVNKVLDELEQKAPEHYTETLAYLEKAEYSESILPNSGRSDGLFSMDGTGDYGFFRFVFLHEVAHRVKGLTNGDWSEDAANAYAEMVVAELHERTKELQAAAAAQDAALPQSDTPQEKGVWLPLAVVASPPVEASNGRTEPGDETKKKLIV